MATAAEIQIQLTLRDQANAGLAQTVGHMQRLGQTAGAAHRPVAGLFDLLGKIGLAGLGFRALTDAGGLLARGLAAPVAAASDLNEQVNKTKVVFGPAAAAVLDFARTTSVSLGQTQTEVLTAISTFGNLFVSMGVARPAAADMGTTMVKLASDMASFNNASPVEVLQALQSGLVGEIEPLRRFGVAINEETVSQRALAMGLAKTKDELSESAKVQARYSLILEQTKTAHGDFANTSTGVANSLRILNAGWGELITQLGQQFLPAVQPVIAMLAEKLPTIIPLVTAALSPLGEAAVAAGKKIAGFLGDGNFEEWAVRASVAVELVLRGLGILAQGFADAFTAILRIVLSIGALILQAFDLLNPFVRHSPSLVESVTLGFAKIGAVIGDLPNRVIPALQRAGAAMSAFGEATRAAMGLAADKSEAAILKQVALLGGEAVPAYIEARDRLAELDEAVNAVSEALEDQQAVLDGMEDALKPLEQGLERATERVRDFKDELSEAQRALDDLTNTPLEGENEQDQVIFGLRNAINILERDRQKLLMAGADPKDKRSLEELLKIRQQMARAGKDTSAVDRQIRLKEIDAEIERTKERLKLEELERKARFDGQRNYIEQVAKAGQLNERNTQDTINGIVEQKKKIEELKPKLAEATAEHRKAAEAVKAQRTEIEAQRGVVAGLRKQYADLSKQASVWRDELGKVLAVSRDLAAEQERAAKALKGAGGAGAGGPLDGFKKDLSGAKIDLEKLLGDLDKLRDKFKAENMPKLDDWQKTVDGFTQPLKDAADALQKLAGGGKDLADAWKNLKTAWTEHAEPVILAIKKAFETEMTNVMRAFVKAWDEELMPALKRLNAWWDSDGRQTAEKMALALGTTLVSDAKAFESAWKLSVQAVLVAWQLWWSSDGARTAREISVWLSQTSIEDQRAFQRGFDSMVYGPLGQVYQLWTSPQGQQTWRQISAWLSSEAPDASQDFFNAMQSNVMGPLGQINTWYQSKEGKATLDALKAWFGTTMPEAAKNFNTAIDQVWETLEALDATKIIDKALKPITDALDKLTQGIKKVGEAWDDLMRKINGGTPPPMPDSGRGGGGGKGGYGGTPIDPPPPPPDRRYGISNVTITNHIDARGMSTGALTQAAGGDLATLARSRLMAGTV